jgi:hypothetical protein
MGDLNAPGINWSTYSSPHTTESDLCDIILQAELKQHNNLPSRQYNDNILDVLCCSDTLKIRNISTDISVLKSDHFAINFDLVYPKSTKPKPIGTNRFIYQFSKTNFDEVGYHLDVLNLDDIILNNIYDLDKAWDEWNTSVLNVINKYVPRFKLKSCHTKPWIDGEVLHLSKIKERLRRTAKRTNKISGWEKYKQANNKLKKVIVNKHGSFLNETCDELDVNPKKFWGLVGAKSSKKGSLPNEMEFNGTKSSDTSVISDHFNTHFHNSFNKNAYVIPDEEGFINDNLRNVLFSPIEVREVLEKLDPNKAYNVGGIPTRIYKECASKLCSSLSLLFNLSLRISKLPAAWKLADVIPIYK